jgi:hypothetical protein
MEQLLNGVFFCEIYHLSAFLKSVDKIQVSFNSDNSDG